MEKILNSKILIADNSASDLLALVNMVKKIGFGTISATDGKQSLQLLESHLPSAVLLDIQMPRMGGLIVCRIIKANPLLASIPVFCTTKTNSVEDKIAALSAGAIDFFLKPIDIRELKARLTNHIPFSIDRSEEKASQDNKGNLIDRLLVQAAKKFIVEGVRDLPTTDEIARHVGTYRERLNILFTSFEGHTMASFIKRERIRQSRDLLIKTNLQIQAIAEMVGFENPANFATSFKDLTGRTPSSFRNANSTTFTADD